MENGKARGSQFVNELIYSILSSFTPLSLAMSEVNDDDGGIRISDCYLIVLLEVYIWFGNFL